MRNFAAHDRLLTIGCTVVTSTGKVGVYVGLVAASTDEWNARVVLAPPSPPFAIEFERTEILHHRDCANHAKKTKRSAR